MRFENARKKKLLETFKRALPLCLMFVALGVGIYFLPEFTTQDLVDIAPSNIIIAILVILTAYAVKSLAMVFPILAIYIAAGLLFPIPLALAVNILGALLNAAIPYFIGRYSCSVTVERLIARHPKLRQVDGWTKKNSVLSMYILRIVGFLPGDVVSLFCGASNVRPMPYFIGSLLGKLPVLTLATIMGTQVENVFSLRFLIPFAGLLILSLGSSYFASKKIRRDETKKHTEPVQNDMEQ
ncbi:MAG: TVP38/TMEM64 family protein [Clostridia bacterium]